MLPIKKITKNYHLFSQLIIVTCCVGLIMCKSGEASRNIRLKNAANAAFFDLFIEIADPDFINELQTSFGEKLLMISEKDTLAWEFIDKDGDKKPDALLILANIGPQEEKNITLKKYDGSPVKMLKMTQAELSVKQGGEWIKVVKESGNEQNEYRGGKFVNIDFLKVPEQHTDHSFYIRYEGPGWESDKIGYRFYLDWRNAVDIYGKKVNDMVLQDVGQDGFESYHEDAAWGMDILKVGSSLGIGSIGYWANEQANRVAVTDSITSDIEQNGNLQSKIITRYYGWNTGNEVTDLVSELSICAGSRLTKHVLSTTNHLNNLCTGIVKHENGKLITKTGSKSNWSYIATFGKQSLADDNLGMVVFYPANQLIQITEDEHSHVVVLNPENKQLTYYFGATWEKDTDHITTREQFEKYLDKCLTLLENPVEITIM